MKTKIIIIAVLLTLIAPMHARAYIEPDMVLNLDLFSTPPNPRDTQSRTADQAYQSQLRREREQERAFALQRPAPEPEVVMEEPEILHGSAPVAPEGYMLVPIQQQPTLVYPQPGNTAANLELARTMRLLSRVNQHQVNTEIDQLLRSSAPDLAPTGAGTAAAVMTLSGCGMYVLRRSKNRSAYTV